MDAACEAEHMKLVAFVMPEHVHLLLCPLSKDPRIDIFLKRVKRPVSVTARDDLRQSSSRLLPRRTVQERPGKTVFRFWQEGPGDDRNLQTCEAVQASIDYIHTNPVKRKLCKIAATWRWSSARQYEFPGEPTDPALPRVTFLPADYWDALATRHNVELT
jgi:putative transposase